MAESPIVAEFLREERPPLQCRWNALPKAVRDAVGSERQWISLYHKHSLLHQHEYDPYVSPDEAAYLEEVLRSSRERTDSTVHARPRCRQLGCAAVGLLAEVCVRRSGSRKIEKRGYRFRFSVGRKPRQHT